MTEQQDLLNEFSEPNLQYATTGQRFGTYLIDIVAFYAIMFVVGVIIGISGLPRSTFFLYFMSFAILLAYYTVMEGSGGRTLGKMVLKTKALNTDGSSITYGKAFMRSLCRFVPFEFVSAFIGGPMWHDKWTDTKVVQNSN